MRANPFIKHWAVNRTCERSDSLFLAWGAVVRTLLDNDGLNKFKDLCRHVLLTAIVKLIYIFKWFSLLLENWRRDLANSMQWLRGIITWFSSVLRMRKISHVTRFYLLNRRVDCLRCWLYIIDDSISAWLPSCVAQAQNVKALIHDERAQ